MADTNTTRALAEAVRERDLANACIDSLEVILFGSLKGRSRDTLEARAAALASDPDANSKRTPSESKDLEKALKEVAAAREAGWGDKYELARQAEALRDHLADEEQVATDLITVVNDEGSCPLCGVQRPRLRYISGIATIDLASCWHVLWAEGVVTAGQNLIAALAAAAGDTSEEQKEADHNGMS